jgi:hypothetical protein
MVNLCRSLKLLKIIKDFVDLCNAAFGEHDGMMVAENEFLCLVLFF